MKRLRASWKTLMLVSLVLCLAGAAWAKPIHIPRHPDYHNGKIAFSYLGDIWVDNTPEDFLKGRDAQLEKAVEVLKEELRKNPPPNIPGR